MEEVELSQVLDHLALDRALEAESNSSSVLRAGKRAALIRDSPPWDSREALGGEQGLREALVAPLLLARRICELGQRPGRRRRLQQPRTTWLTGEIALNDHGFVLTGHELDGAADGGAPPLLLETSRPGVFAVGDVRAGSVKRVASAVGEGSMAVRLVHQHLAER